MGAFHAYDIRGIYNIDFDKEIVYKVGYFIPKLLKVDKVLVGRDVRESSPEIHEYLLRGITDAGADVHDIGISTTPMVYYATATLGFAASVQITASHNPKEYNGLKVSRENALPVGYDDGLGEIEQWIKEGKNITVAEKRGEVFSAYVKENYLDFLLGFKKSWLNLKISMDLSNGMAALLAKDIFGSTPYYIFDELDGTFPNHEANPLVPENVRFLQDLVLKKGSDVGVIFDGDADRVMFIDEKGRFISPDLIIAVLGHHFLKDVKQGEVYNVLQDIRSSMSVGEYLVPMGATMNTWKVGRAFAAKKLREIDGIYGGELAGHYYFKDFFYSDSGLLASILVLNVIAEKKREGVSLSELIDNISKYQNSGELNFKIEDKVKAMDYVKNFFISEEDPKTMYDFDGYRVEFKDWWFNIRPSNTEPYLRFICEANSKELLDEKVNKTIDLLLKVTKYGLGIIEG